jgi:hypothetical protein
MDKEKIATQLRQSEEITKYKNKIIQIVQEDKQRRDQEMVYFRNQNLLTYIETGIAQFLGYRSKPEWKKDYQYNVFDPITRDKVIAILSKTAGLYEAEFFNTNKRLTKISETIATVCEAFYKDSTRRLNEKEKNKLTMLAALITPKAIWYEGWRYQKRTIKEIEERDGEGKITKVKSKEIVHYNGPWGELVPVEDFIPGSLKIRDIQEQPRLTWIPKMQMEQFRRIYTETKYPEAKKVQPYGVLFNNEFNDFIVRNDLKDNEVEVIMYFDKWKDQYAIIANGVLLTKIEAPMPFAHKDYPFVWGGFEELSPFFVYDMPLSIKLLDMQDMNNEILNLSLDMVWRALNEVILVQDGDGINDDVLYGGGMVSVNDPKNFQKLEFGSSFGFQSATNMIDRARRSIEGSSVDAPASGQSGARAITAREAMIAREAALEITTLFLQNMENMEKDKARLRVKNQLDRYSRPIDWKKHIGEDLTEKAIPTFREISVRDAKLDGNKRGTINVTITNEPRPKEELDKINTENDKELSQTIDITPELIREIDFDVEIVANSSVRKSKTIQTAEARAFLQEAAAMPQVLNVGYAAEEYVKALNKRPDEALAQQEEQDPMAMMMGGMAGANKPGTPEAPQMPKDSLEDLLNQSV